MVRDFVLWISVSMAQATAAQSESGPTPPDSVIGEADALFAAGKAGEGRARLTAGAEDAEAAGDLETAAARRSSLGVHERELSRFAEAIAVHELALALDRRLHADDHESVARDLNEIGCCLHHLGRYAEALPNCEEALAMRQRLFPGDHPEVANTLTNVATCLDFLGRGTEALPMYEEALAMRQRLFPGDNEDVAWSLDNLALSLASLGRPNEALANSEEAFAMRQRLFDGDHPDVATSLNNVALGLSSIGRAEEALPMYEEALAMRKRHFEGDHSDVATSLDNFAFCLDALGRAEEALENSEAALAMRQRLFDGDKPEIALSLNSVASYLRALGRRAEALPKYEEAYAMFRRLFPGDHPFVAACLDNLAGCVDSLGRPMEAMSKLEEVLAMRQRLFKGDHPEVAWTLGNIAACLDSVGHSDRALPKFEEALAMYRRLYRGNHPDVALSLNAFASCLISLGRSAEALPILEEALAIYRGLFKGDHPDIARTLHDIANCLRALGRFQEALLTFEEALAMRQRLFKGDHPDVASSLNSVAICLQAFDRFAEATPKSEEALAMRRRLFPGDHRAVANGLHNVASCLKARGRTEEALLKFEEAIAMWRRLFPSGNPELVHSLVGVALLHTENSATRGLAAASVSQAIEIVEQTRLAARALDSEHRSMYFWELRRSDPYTLARRIEVKLDHRDAALAIAERTRGRFLLDLIEGASFDPLAEAEREALVRGDDEGAAAIADLRASLAHVEQEDARLTHDAARISSQARLSTDEREAQRAALEPEFAKLVEERDRCNTERARMIADVLPVLDPASPEMVRAALGPNELLLFFALDNEQSDLFLVDRENVDVISIPAKREAVALAVDQLRGMAGAGQTMRGNPVDESGPATVPTVDLFAQLIPHAAWDRIRKAPRVIVIPDGALHRFPLEALEVAPGRTWLDDGPPVAYAPSASVFSWIRRGSAVEQDDTATLELLALGDPNFAIDDPHDSIPEHGALIAGIVADSPAERAGLRRLDVVVRFDGAEITDDEELRNALQRCAMRPGPLAVTVVRDGGAMDVEVPSGKLGIQIGRGGAREAFDLGFGQDPEEHEVARMRGRERERFGRLVRLPATRTEVNAAARAFETAHQRVRVLLGAEATESKMFELASEARYLHFATHGLLDETFGHSQSALALTAPEIATSADDGFLKLGELFGRWRGQLDGCRMVVLSACDTQVGVEQRDEGPFALSFGFIFAGASSVISSLWKVDDASTAELMSDFYARLAKTGPHADRLAEFTAARKALKAKGAPARQWAPFVYVGSPN